jgi:DNA ligase (NAD+)
MSSVPNSKTDAIKRVNKLRAEIAHHRYLYHVLDTQEISDAALDSLKHELKTIEDAYPELITKNSPTQRIAGAVRDGFKKVQHTERMLSIEDAFSEKEVEAWLERLKSRFSLKKSEFFCEVKMDGLAMALRYETGTLQTAITRGTGKVGEDVTHNARAIESVPLEIRQPTDGELEKLKRLGVPTPAIAALQDVAKLSIEIRGEVYFPKSTFVGLNKKLKRDGVDMFANPRNAAAGTIRQLDPSVTAYRKLGYFGYSISTDIGLVTHEQEHQVMRLLGIPINPIMKTCKTVKQISSFYEKLIQQRASLDYWTDGVVININDSKEFLRVGVAGKAPRGALAWKYPAEEATTKLIAVDWSVGRSGTLTPVAQLEPVWVAGTTVQHASLHNIDEINRLDIRVGDTVIIHKAGDIIPKVIRVLDNLRNGSEQKIKVPISCPVCDSAVRNREGEVAVVCESTDCYARLRQRIIYAIGKEGFDIDGLGGRTIDQLLEKCLIHNTASIFELKKDDLLKLEGFAEISAAKLYDEIQIKSSIQLSRFLTALGIPHVGSETALKIAEHFGTLDAIMRAKLEDLDGVDSVGPVVAESIIEYFGSERHRRNIADFQSNGGSILSQARRTGMLGGKTVVFTGTLQHVTRDEARSAIVALGGQVSSSVSSGTDFVVVGESPGSKARKAKGLGVKSLNEREFFDMIGKEIE